MRVITGHPQRKRRHPHALRALLLCVALLPVTLAAQVPSEAETAAAQAVYAAGTGDAWVDRQLADINTYAARYPDAFTDELVRYAGAHPLYVKALLNDHRWPAGDIYFACVWGRIIGEGCRPWVRARTALPGASWKEVLESRQPPPENLQWRALRHAIVASFDHWDRPITLDSLLKRQLGDRARRDAAAITAAETD